MLSCCVSFQKRCKVREFFLTVQAFAGFFLFLGRFFLFLLVFGVILGCFLGGGGGEVGKIE